MYGPRQSKLPGYLWLAYAKHKQNAITTSGAIISSNGRSKISVSEVMDHFIMPDYPATSENGIIHFIHCQNPIQSEDKSSIREALSREMSKVCLACA